MPSVMGGRASPGLSDWRSSALGAAGRRYWFLALAILVWIAPLAREIAVNVWSTDQGAQGPLILATGGWLLAVRLREGRALARPGGTGRAVAALIGCAVLWVLARRVNMLSAQLLAAWLVLVTLLYAHIGARLLRRCAFPLGYLLFLIPPPFFFMWPVVQGLKLWIAMRAVSLAAAAGLEVANSGGTIFVDQYELSVEAACAGLNSLYSLLALGALYIYLRHPADRRHAVPLAAMIVPLAILANLIRVLLLIGFVHRFGVGVLETPVHVATGLVMALVAMVLLVLVDVASVRVGRWGRRWRTA